MHVLRRPVRVLLIVLTLVVGAAATGLVTTQTVWFRHWLKGYIAIALLARQARDGTALPKGWWNPGASLVNSKNIDEIQQRQQNNATRTAYYKATVDKELANPSAYLKPMPGGK